MNAEQKISYDTTYPYQFARHLGAQVIWHTVLAYVFSYKYSMSDDDKRAIHFLLGLIIFILIASGMPKQGMINGGAL